MLKIRLRRVGRKNEPHYQLVVAPHTNPVKSNYLANVGWYNPTTKEIHVDKEAVLEWIRKGARPSERVAKLLVAEKIDHPAVKVIIHTPRPPKKSKKETAKKAVAPATDTKDAEVTTEEIAAPKKEDSQPDNNQEQPKPDNNTDKVENNQPNTNEEVQ